MEDRSYSSLSRHGLASSNSLLDGVPFKIGQNFKPPPKIVAGPELCRPHVPNVLSVEYAFETEEAVLAWAQAREEALKQAAQEQAETLAEEQRKQVEEMTANIETDGESNIKPGINELSGANQNGGNIYDVPRSTNSSQQNHASLKQKPYLPSKLTGGVSKQMSEPGAILKPTPIRSSASSVLAKKTEASADNKLANSSSSFDVSMFESEDDPFDNLELQTLNDMEELKILLDSSTKSSADIVTAQTTAGHPQPALDTDHGSTGQLGDSAAEIIYDMATVVKENTWETFSDHSPEQGLAVETDSEISDQREGSPSPSVGCPNADDNSGQITEDGEYVEITSSYKKQTIKFQNHSASRASNVSNSEDTAEKSSADTVFGGKLPSSLANSKLYKPVLPPFMKSGSTANDNSNSNNNPFSESSTQGSNPFLPQTTHDTKNPFLQNTSDHWSLFSQTSELDSRNNDGPVDQNDSAPKTSSAPTPAPRTSLLPPPPPTNRSSGNRHPVLTPRMWASVGPSLAASLDESSSTSEQIPYNSYSRHSLSSSDIHLSSSCSDLGERNCKSTELQKPITSQSTFQLWNRHRPLPPIPSPSSTATHNPNLASESYKVNLLPPSQQVGLTDPYHSLSQEAQAFTNSLTSMGFLRARVARAVAKFGQDEKEVLDHLIAVDMLVDKKFAPVLAESALSTFKNDVEKADKFLQMLTQFEELGFTSEKIQEALTTTNMDYDKVLDILTT